MRGAHIVHVKQSKTIIGLLNNAPTPSTLSDLETGIYQEQWFHEIDDLLLDSAAQHGLCYGFANEQDGRLVQNIFPIKNDSQTQISSSSDVELELHTETAFHSERADTVFLFCLRPDPSAGTVISELDSFITDLDSKTKSILKEPVFQTTIDESFKRSSSASMTLQIPILSKNEKSISFDKALMSGLTEEAELALVELLQAIRNHQKIVTLNAGEALIFDNKSTIHGRTRFTAKHDGSDRWLKRIMIKDHEIAPGKSFINDDGYPVVTALH